MASNTQGNIYSALANSLCPFLRQTTPSKIVQSDVFINAN